MSLFKKLSLSVCMTMLSLYSTQAQVYKQNGTIVYTNKDTVQALIKSGYKLQNKLQVIYKEATSGAKFRTSGPEEILAYSHDKDSYQSLEVNGERIFVRTNLVGYISLYETVDQDGNISFYLKKDEGELQIIQQENFKSFINTYFGDCSSKEMTNAINKVRYTRFRIANVVSQYNACKFPNKYVAANFEPQHHVKFNVLAGVELFNVKFPFSISRNLEPDASSTDIAPVIGFNLLFEGERRASTGVEVSFNKYKFDLDFDGVLQENFIGEQTLRTYKATKVNASFFFRYKLLEKSGLYLRFGPTFAFAEFVPDKIPETIIIDNPNSVLVGALVGLNYQVSNKIGVMFDYRYARGSSTFRFQDNTVSNAVSLAASYKIN